MFELFGGFLFGKRGFFRGFGGRWVGGVGLNRWGGGMVVGYLAGFLKSKKVIGKGA